VVDEVDYIPFDPEAANLMFSLVSARYERASLIVTSNKPFSAWGEIFGDEMTAIAMIDRVVHTPKSSRSRATPRNGRLASFRLPALKTAHSDRLSNLSPSTPGPPPTVRRAPSACRIGAVEEETHSCPWEKSAPWPLVDSCLKLSASAALTRRS
jgi:IstB-like ATP binding protein